MNNTQQQVIDHLRANPRSTGAEILEGTGKTKSSIDSALKALRDKGFCRKSGFSESAWQYELTVSCEKNGFSSEAPDRSTIALNAEPTLGRRPFSYAVYAPAAWESARSGADDHKAHVSLSGERA